MERLLKFLDFGIVWQYREMVVSGIGLTIAISLVTLSISLPLGLAIALIRRLGPRWAQVALTVVVDFFRSVPTVLSVVFIFLGLPFAGVTLSAFTSVVLAMSLMQTAYLSEIFRGALAAVPGGQADAGLSLGMSRSAILRTVVIPQAAVVAAPAFVSSLVLMIQITSISATIGLNELLGASLTIQTISGQPSPILFAGIVYLAALLPLVRLMRKWERRMAKAF